MSGRLFNEKEVGKILKQASAAQEREGDGITLEQLKQVGSELGYDPKQIELAARNLGSDDQSKGRLFNPRVSVDRTVDGPISADDWEGMVAAMQRHYKKLGAVTQRGANYDWVASSSEECSSLTLTVINRDGRGRVRVESSQSLALFFTILFGPMLALVFSLTAMKHGMAGLTLAIVAGVAALMFLLLRHFRAGHVESVSRLMEQLIDEVDPNRSSSVHSEQTASLPAPNESLPIQTSF